MIVIVADKQGFMYMNDADVLLLVAVYPVNCATKYIVYVFASARLVDGLNIILVGEDVESSVIRLAVAGAGETETEYVTPVVQGVSTVTAIDVAAVSVIRLLLCPFTFDISKLINDKLYASHVAKGIDAT